MGTTEKKRKGRELSVEHICTILLYICQHPLRKIACFVPFRSQSSDSISASKTTKYPSRYRVYAPTKFIISLALITVSHIDLKFRNWPVSHIGF